LVWNYGTAFNVKSIEGESALEKVFSEILVIEIENSGDIIKQSFVDISSQIPTNRYKRFKRNIHADI
jgi:hypothetical protein